MLILTGCGQIGPLTLPPQSVQGKKDDTVSGQEPVDRKVTDPATR